MTSPTAAPATRRIVANFFLTLDGVMEAPETWQFPYFDEEMGAAVGAGMATTDALLMGATPYREWSQQWPDREGELAVIFNAIPKYVVSDSLDRVEWSGSTLPRGTDAADGLRALKARRAGTSPSPEAPPWSDGCSARDCSTSCTCWSARSWSAPAAGCSSRTCPPADDPRLVADLQHRCPPPDLPTRSLDRSLMMESKGPASYFPSIEKQYGHPISYWVDLIQANTELTRHGELVTWLKQEHGLGHGHATALVGHTLKNEP